MRKREDSEEAQEGRKAAQVFCGERSFLAAKGEKGSKNWEVWCPGGCVTGGGGLGARGIKKGVTEVKRNGGGEGDVGRAESEGTIRRIIATA